MNVFYFILQYYWSIYYKIFSKLWAGHKKINLKRSANILYEFAIKVLSWKVNSIFCSRWECWRGFPRDCGRSIPWDCGRSFPWDCGRNRGRGPPYRPVAWGGQLRNCQVEIRHDNYILLMRFLNMISWCTVYEVLERISIFKKYSYFFVLNKVFNDEEPNRWPHKVRCGQRHDVR